MTQNNTLGKGFEDKKTVAINSINSIMMDPVQRQGFIDSAKSGVNGGKRELWTEEYSVFFIDGSTPGEILCQLAVDVDGTQFIAQEFKLVVPTEDLEV